MNKLPEDNFTKNMHAGEQLNMPLKYLAASSIVGDKVHDDKDAHMGDIKNIVIDITTGKIDYYVIEFGGLLGIGQKYFAIPYDILRVDPVKKTYIFTQPKEKLAEAPGFNHWHWPNTNFHLTEDFWHFV
jgi:sporulation protein YlmC with PRC-barrel domain